MILAKTLYMFNLYTLILILVSFLFFFFFKRYLCHPEKGYVYLLILMLYDYCYLCEQSLLVCWQSIVVLGIGGSVEESTVMLHISMRRKLDGEGEDDDPLVYRLLAKVAVHVILTI